MIQERHMGTLKESEHDFFLQDGISPSVYILFEHVMEYRSHNDIILLACNNDRVIIASKKHNMTLELKPEVDISNQRLELLEYYVGGTRVYVLYIRMDDIGFFAVCIDILFRDFYYEDAISFSSRNKHVDMGVGFKDKLSDFIKNIITRKTQR